MTLGPVKVMVAGVVVLLCVVEVSTYIVFSYVICVKHTVDCKKGNVA